MSDLFYTNEEGRNVNTSKFLKNRGSCCKTNCLHCPYGFTLKNNPLTFEKVSLDTLKEAQAYIDFNNPQEDTIASGLLDSAFGGKKKITLNKFNYQNFSFIKLKDIRCGVAHEGRLQIKEVFLGEHFQDQGLDLDTVRGFSS
ncbi:MAG: DUF5522 domain-containing protein [Bdellovibrionota bacterium]|nr:DUF5522 domain-containing protein [Bdellovibrionota bacterium]